VVYRIKRLPQPAQLDTNWEGPVWADVDALQLMNHMGERPAHFPTTQARLVYDAESIHVMFRVEDRYVRAIAEGHGGPVWRDACVEFFFAPSDAPMSGYFNLEMNCGGSILFNHQFRPWKEKVPVPLADIERLEVFHSLPKIVDPEITAPIVWTAGYRLPFALVARHCPTMKTPTPGVTWRANFYKCAENNSHPHWLTWNKVEFPKPNFHMPEYFGTIEFMG
jgi:hypothetical protein